MTAIVRQLSLLEQSEVSVPGLGYFPDYVSEEEARALMEAVDRGAWVEDWKRRRQIYGVSYSRTGDAAPPIPDWLRPLIERVERDGHLEAGVANVVVNEYLPGQGIGLHRDYAPFGPTVVAVSLGSDVLLDFVEPVTGARCALDVAPRSLWRITGPARSSWQHGIAHRSTDRVHGALRPRGRRVSITMRTLAGASSEGERTSRGARRGPIE